MPRQQPERLVKTLAETRRHLLEWGITQLFMRTAYSRGAKQEEFVTLYRKFVRQYYGRVGTGGQMILDHPSKARYWSLQFLADNGWPVPKNLPMSMRYPSRDPRNTGWIYGKDWQGLQVNTKSGRRLRWRLWENPDPDVYVDYEYGPDEPDDYEPDDAA